MPVGSCRTRAGTAATCRRAAHWVIDAGGGLPAERSTGMGGLRARASRREVGEVKVLDDGPSREHGRVCTSA